MAFPTLEYSHSLYTSGTQFCLCESSTYLNCVPLLHFSSRLLTFNFIPICSNPTCYRESFFFFFAYRAQISFLFFSHYQKAINNLIQLVMMSSCARRPMPLSRLFTLPVSPLPFASSVSLLTKYYRSQAQSALHSPLRAAIAGLIIGASAAVAGLVLGQLSAPRNQGASGCDSCGGTGWIDCTLCQHWDYSAVQNQNNKKSRIPPRCSSCGGSSRTRCPRCGGRGLTIPTLNKAPVPVRIDQNFDVLRRFLAAPAAFITTLSLIPQYRLNSRPHLNNSVRNLPHAC